MWGQTDPRSAAGVTWTPPGDRSENSITWWNSSDVKHLSQHHDIIQWHCQVQHTLCVCACMRACGRVCVCVRACVPNYLLDAIKTVFTLELYSVFMDQTSHISYTDSEHSEIVLIKRTTYFRTHKSNNENIETTQHITPVQTYLQLSWRDSVERFKWTCGLFDWNISSL